MIQSIRFRNLVSLLAAAMLAANLSCATTLRFLSEVTNDEAPTIYGGTEIDIVLIYGGLTVLESPLDCGGLALLALVGGLVDLPFSFVADTLLLPITLPAYFLSREKDSPHDTETKPGAPPERESPEEENRKWRDTDGTVTIDRYGIAGRYPPWVFHWNCQQMISFIRSKHELLFFSEIR